MPALSNETVSPTPAAPAPAPSPDAGLPSPFVDVATGKVPAISVPPIVGSHYTDIQKYLVENFDTVLSAGLDFTELDGALSVFFNPKLLSEQDVWNAAKDGTLQKIAPVADKLGAPPGAPPAPVAAPAGPQGAPPAAAPAQSSPAGALAGMTATPAGPAPGNAAVRASRLANVKPAPVGPGAGPLPALQKRAI